MSSRSVNLKRHIHWVPLTTLTHRQVPAWKSSTLIVRSGGACDCHLPAVMPHTAIPDAHAALKGLEKTANAGR